MQAVFAGGGTGGHIYPGLSVAEALRRRRPDVEVVFLATGRPIDREVIPAAGHRLVQQSVRPLPSLRRPWQIPGFLWHWFAGKRLAGSVLRDDAVVLGLGGYAAGPGIRVAVSRGLPTAIVNPDLVPGKANVWAAGKVDEVYCQWPESASHFPDADPSRIIATGCPIRGNITGGDRAAAAAEFGLDAGRRTLVVTGASQGSKSVNEAVLALGGLLDRHAGDWQVLHLTGRGDHDAVAPRWAGRRIAVRTVPFTGRMDLVYALADLVISRAGAGTLAELTAVGRASILMPYPHHGDQHQRRNAEVLAARGAAVVQTDHIDPAANAAGLGPVLERLMAAPAEVAGMAEAARSIGKPDAADRVAERLITLWERSAARRRGTPCRTGATASAA